MECIRESSNNLAEGKNWNMGQSIGSQMKTKYFCGSFFTWAKGYGPTKWLRALTIQL